MQLLSGGPRPAGEIADCAGVSRPVMSRHLRVMLRAGVVTDERDPADARLRIFRLRPDSVAGLQAWLDLVPTMGGFSRMTPEQQDGLLTGMGAAVDSFGGSFTMTSATVVLTATRT